MTQNVYISSTNDLAPYRDQAKAAIDQIGLRAIRWEEYSSTADTANPLKLMHNEIDNSDIFIGIYGRRYGGKPNVDEEGKPIQDGRSYVEIEFDWAFQKGIPCLLFFISTDSPDTVFPTQHLEGVKREGESGTLQLDAFRKKVMQHLIVDTVMDEYHFLVRVLIRLGRLLIPKADSMIVSPIFGAPLKDKNESKDKYESDAFMIMPFASEFSPIYEGYIKPVLKEFTPPLEPKRGDNFFGKHDIMQEIWSALNACCFVICECTGRNPNVFYELGIAHTLGKPFILIAQSLEDIPFDLQSKRVVIYKNNAAGLVFLQEKLREYIRVIMAETSHCGKRPSVLSDEVPRRWNEPVFYVRLGEHEG